MKIFRNFENLLRYGNRTLADPFRLQLQQPPLKFRAWKEECV